MRLLTIGALDPLLATKLFVPGAQPGFVSRPRLVEALDAGLGRGFVLICAPAGFGKTALLSEWCSPRSVAWLSLDPGDSDPARFWRYTLAALDRARPGIADRVGPLLGPPAPPSYEGLVTAVINELVGPDEGEVVLVLDDYHVIDSQAVHATLALLLERRPPGLRVVLTSRADPPLPLARLRARGQLAELRAADLRFSVEEAAALLQEAVDVPLPEGSVAALAHRTEGWAAGLRLAALAVGGRPDVADFVTSFSGSHRYVLDYLTEEVLERQTGEVRGFLLETSVLERLSAHLCDAVTGRSDGEAMLETIDRANLFLVPVDEGRGWWRYHQLFADLLRARLQRQGSERVRQLHRNAAGWYERRGLADDAIGHATAAGDTEWAARMIERQVDTLLLRNEGVTLQRWLTALPAEVVDSRPRLLLAQADVALGSGRVTAAEHALDAAERAFDEARDERVEPPAGKPAGLVANVPAAIAFWRAYLADLHGDAERAIALDHEALAELGDGPSVLASTVRLHLHAVELLRGELPEAERALASSVAELRAAGEIYPALRACELLGHVQRARGRLDAAVETYREGLEIAAVTGRPPLPAAGIAHVGAAEVAYQRGELDAALGHATEGVALCRQLTYPRPLAAGLATLARIRLAEGDPAGAVEILEGSRQVAPSLGVTNLLDPLPALRARLLLARGDLAAAVRWTSERGLGPDDQVSYLRESEHLVLARLLLAQDQPERGLALLDRLHALADAQGRTGSVIEVQALRAVAQAAAGDHDGAVGTLAAALTLGHPQGYVRVFADEGPPMSDLLGRLIAAQRNDGTLARDLPLGYLGRVMRAVEHGTAPAAPAARRRGTGVPGLVEALTGRELEVLRLLAAGRSNRQIAGELYVALDTVKKHVSHIFEKLGAGNRTEASVRARELGLLADAAGGAAGAATPRS